MGARGGWVEIGTSQTEKFDVTGLVNKKEYKFRVRAVNKKGASDPLVSAKPIIAKDPYGESRFFTQYFLLRIRELQFSYKYVSF